VTDSVGELANLKREGKIRHIGVSNFTLEQLKGVRDEAPIVSLQNRYSVMSRRDQDEIIDYCEAEQITYLPWNPVGGRGNAPKIGEMYDVLDDVASAHDASPHAVALAWLLQRSPVIVPIPGTTKFGHLKENIVASEVELSAEEVERLDGLDRPGE
jgi:aryl-alcohol dehydrogenase-like predicted oxidoreductase